MIHDYRDAEFTLFSLHGVTRGVCDCGNEDCQALYKHPRSSAWQHTPVWSDEQFQVQMDNGYFTTGFGVIVKHMLIVDVDARNGGVDSFHKLCSDLEIDLLGDCEFAVATGSGGGSMHLYFAYDGTQALSSSLKEYKGIDFKSNGYVVGCGSQHASGGQYELIHGSPDAVEQAPGALLALLAKKTTFRSTVNDKHVEVSNEQIADMLSHIDAGCSYDEWLSVGMAIHHTTGGAGYDLFDTWSATSDKYPSRDTMINKWHSFGKTSGNPVTIGTLWYMATSCGWKPAVQIDGLDWSDDTGDHPFHIDTVDLLRPVGFVGKVTDWINNQCRYPRENLAVASALSVVSNCAGLRWTDDLSGVTANMFLFCVAGSATGKEAVQQAMYSLYREVGIAKATHGSVKSEQEIIRNLIRNQAAFYMIDEVGILLSKIANSSKSGASYLEGVIGTLMSAYSKADGAMLLTGDAKEDVRRALSSELNQVKRMRDDNEGDRDYLTARIEQLKSALSGLDMGLDKPFLSMIGFTTPSTFNSVVNHEQATNGFIGRSLIINERETNPRCKKRFKKEPINDGIIATLQNLYSAGHFDQRGEERVEYYGERSQITTTPDAEIMLEKCLDWVFEYAEQHKQQTGLEAIVRRGYELIAKLSLILAVGDGQRTTEHVRWAYTMVRRDIDEKIMLVVANSDDQGSDELRMKIISMLSDGQKEALGTICNRLRKFKKDDVKAMLAKLCEKGYIKTETTKHPINGRETELFYS